MIGGMDGPAARGKRMRGGVGIGRRCCLTKVFGLTRRPYLRSGLGAAASMTSWGSRCVNLSFVL